MGIWCWDSSWFLILDWILRYPHLSWFVPNVGTSWVWMKDVLALQIPEVGRFLAVSHVLTIPVPSLEQFQMPSSKRSPQASMFAPKSQQKLAPKSIDHGCFISMHKLSRPRSCGLSDLVSVPHGAWPCFQCDFSAQGSWTLGFFCFLHRRQMSRKF